MNILCFRHLGTIVVPDPFTGNQGGRIKKEAFWLELPTAEVDKMGLDKKNKSVVWQVFDAYPQDVTRIDFDNGSTSLIIRGYAPNGMPANQTETIVELLSSIRELTSD